MSTFFRDDLSFTRGYKIAFEISLSLFKPFLQKFAGLIVYVALVLTSCSVAKGSTNVVEAQAVAKARQALYDNPNYDLAIVKKMIPRIFIHKKARVAFFSEPMYVGSEKKEKKYVRTSDLRFLSQALSSHAAHAAQRNDLSRARHSLEIIADICSTVAKLTPPKQVLEGRTKIPGYQRIYYQIGVVSASLDQIRIALKSIAAISDKNRILVAPARQQCTRLQAVVRHYAQQILPVLKTEPPDSLKLRHLYREELRLLRHGIPILKRRISTL